MSFNKIAVGVIDSIDGAKSVASLGFKVLKSDIAIVVYSIFVFLLVLLTVPIINALLLAFANTLAHESIFAAEEHTVKVIFVTIATFVSIATVAMLLTYFTCAVAASTLSQLDGHPVPLLKGLKLFRVRFRRITKFAMVSIAYIPIGFAAQHRKLGESHRKKAEVTGSSFSLSSAQLAPAILLEDIGLYETVNYSIDTLGKAWRESLVIKIATYVNVFILTLLIGFMPTLIQSYISSGTTAQAASQAVTILLFIGLLITSKVLGTVFTTALYWKIVTDHGRRGKLIK